MEEKIHEKTGKLFACHVTTFNLIYLAFAQADVKKVDLTQNQKNILRAYGLSDEEIQNIDIETIRDTLRNGVVVDSEKFAEKPDWNKNKLTAEIKAKLDKKNLSQSEIK